MGRSHTYRKPDVGSHICRKPRWGGGGGIPYLKETQIGDPISPVTLDRRESHICRKPSLGHPISAGNLDVGIPYLQKTYMGGGGIPWEEGSHICRKPRLGIPYLQEP